MDKKELTKIILEDACNAYDNDGYMTGEKLMLCKLDGDTYKKIFHKICNALHFKNEANQLRREFKYTVFEHFIYVDTHNFLRVYRTKNSTDSSNIIIYLHYVYNEEKSETNYSYAGEDLVCFVTEGKWLIRCDYPGIRHDIHVLNYVTFANLRSTYLMDDSRACETSHPLILTNPWQLKETITAVNYLYDLTHLPKTSFVKNLKDHKYPIKIIKADDYTYTLVWAEDLEPVYYIELVTEEVLDEEEREYNSSLDWKYELFENEFVIGFHHKFSQDISSIGTLHRYFKPDILYKSTCNKLITAYIIQAQEDLIHKILNS